MPGRPRCPAHRRRSASRPTHGAPVNPSARLCRRRATPVIYLDRKVSVGLPLLFAIQEPLRARAPMSRPTAGAHPRVWGASFCIPGAGVHTNAGPHPNAPAAPAPAPLAIDKGLAAKGTGSGSVAKVAPVRLQAMEKGLAIPKMPVAPVALPKMEIRPAEKPENCGDDKDFVACPTLKMRYDTPYSPQTANTFGKTHRCGSSH